MKILYSCGNRVGANLQLQRFLENTSHEVKVAAYLKSSQSLNHIDWTLDALSHPYNRNDRNELAQIFGQQNIPAVGVEEVELLISDIHEYEPDLVICDFEPIVSHIASSLGLRLWYCSPVHLLDGIVWPSGWMRYAGLLAKTRQTLLKLPKSEKTFIYSPFGDLSNPPQIREGYEWVSPFAKIGDKNSENIGIAVINCLTRISILSKILNCVPPFNITLFCPVEYRLSHLEVQNIENIENYQWSLSNARWVFNTGETSLIADALYNRVASLCISPSLDDPEEMLNASLCHAYQLGVDVGRIEYLEKYATDHLKELYSQNCISQDIKPKNLTLTERIENEICRT